MKTAQPILKTKQTKNIIWDFENESYSLPYSNIHTVCEESRCPNRYECFQQKIVTFLIGGSFCTRSCKFCHISTGKPLPLKSIVQNELKSIVNYAIDNQSKYIVLTAVARDDDEIALANHFANITNELQKMKIEVEVLIPDFHAKEEYLHIIAKANPIVIAQNIETVKSLTKKIRPQGSYERTRTVFEFYKKNYPKIILKSGFMLGLGETFQEVSDLLNDLERSSVDIITVGQYLQPSQEQFPVQKIYAKQEFVKIQNMINIRNFLASEVGPFVRSSYMASRTMQKVKKVKRSQHKIKAKNHFIRG